MAWLLVLILSSAPAGQTPPSSDDAGAKPAATPARPAEKAGAGEESGKATKDSSKKSAEAKPSKKASTAPKTIGGPRVLTRSEMLKPKSQFLSPPGAEGVEADKYGPGTPDWSEVPPWRQASFFGVRAQGRFFVYVIDCSQSMIEEDRFARATMEVRRSVLALQAPQQFEVIFYNDGSIPMPGGPQPRPADTQNKAQLVSWLRIVDPDGGTDPRSALRQALSLRPEAVFLLSDGEFSKGTAEAVAHFNPNRVPIHCVDLSGGEGDQMRRIARDSGGKFAVRPGTLQGKR